MIATFRLSLLFIFIFLLTGKLFSQSNPQVLKPGISINRLMTVKNGAIRMGKDPVSRKLFYIQTGGNIYKVIQPSSGPAYDSLVFTSADHHVNYVQGMVFFDSTWYVSGNNHSDSSYTVGIIARGKLLPNNTRRWDTLMVTQYYQTADYFDHLFSGVALNPAGDSIYICSGARGDHGEVQTRYGQFPGTRNVPLTTNIFELPTKKSTPIILQNDSVWLNANGYVFCRGVRNHFDLAFDARGHLFGLENSGDRDHNEEMNWLQKGHHYGFPWKMGDTDNPAQIPTFNPATDPLISHYSNSWRNGFWTTDPSFPHPPSGTVFDAPIQNFGPDCDKFRDTLGHVHDASDMGISLGTFTGHRSPLGLVFDNAQVLAPVYRGDAFMLSWTKGLDSCGCTTVPDSGIGPYVDPSQDLVHLDLHFDSIARKFSLNATRIIAEFQHPVDEEIDSNKIYVLENGYGGTSGLFKVTLPVMNFPCNPVLHVTIADSCSPGSNIIYLPLFGTLPNYVKWYNSAGTLLRSDTMSASADTIKSLPSGSYYTVITDSVSCGTDTLSFVIPDSLNFQINSFTNESCPACNDGNLLFNIHGGTPPYSYLIPPGSVLSGNSITHLDSGSYQVCATDSRGCVSCDSVTIAVMNFPCNPTLNVNIPDLCSPLLNSVSLPAFGILPDYVSWYHSTGTLLRADTIFTSADTIFLIPSGSYYVIIRDLSSCGIDTILFSIPDTFAIHITSSGNTSCVGCNDGYLTFNLTGGNPPFAYAVSPGGMISGDSIINIPPGLIQVCVTDANGCVTCDTVSVFDDPTGIESLSSGDKLNLFPNPVHSTLYINMKSNSSADNDVSIMNALGEIVYEKKTSLFHTLTIDISRLKSGLYILLLKKEQEMVISKFVKE